MQDQDSKFESYLREFTPHRPQPLEQAALAQRLWPRRLAAAAAMAIGLGTLLWSGRQNRDQNVAQSFQGTRLEPAGNASGSELLLLPMTRLALDDPQQLDAKLTKAARTILPNFRKSDSALRVLAKE